MTIQTIVFESGSWTVFLTAILSNALLINITFSTKTLRSPCNLLIAVNAALSVFVNVGLIAQYLMFPAVWPEGIPVERCFALTAAYYVIFETFTVFPMAIAFERLLGVLFPVWVQYRNEKLYTVGIMVPVFLYGIIFTLYIGVRFVVPGKVVACNTCDVYCTDIASWATFTSYGILGACWTMYMTMWIVYKVQYASQTPNWTNGDFKSTFRRLSRSITVIVVLDTVGWLTPPFAQTILSLLNLPSKTYSAIFAPLSLWSIDLGAILTMPALYLISQDYRKATNSFFARFSLFNNNQQQTSTSTEVVPITLSTIRKY